MGKKQVSRAASMLLVSSLLFAVPSVRCEAAVITSNATDKIAVAFHAGTDYSAGDYVIYDAELYICTQETKGEWETVQADFMQITKNRHDKGIKKELVTGKDLSASYQDSKDPSEETSLMAFVANAWQKMKSFFGIGEADSATDGQDYKGASVSAKLNYLKDQGSTMDAEISDLKGSASDLKGSVSELKGSV